MVTSSYCPIKSLAPWPHILLSHIILGCHCPILVFASARLESDNYKVYWSLVWLDREPNSRYPAREASALPIRPPRPVEIGGWQTCLSWHAKWNLIWQLWAILTFKKRLIRCYRCYSLNNNANLAPSLSTHTLLKERLDCANDRHWWAMLNISDVSTINKWHYF